MFPCFIIIYIKFLSTLSLRRATDTSKDTIKTVTNFYPRSPCGERQAANGLADAPPKISIHALLAESDRLPTALRTPHHRFLSTLSLRRATAVLQQAQQEADISIHALLAESDLLEQSASYNAALISIHALLAESDACGSR